MIRVLSDIESMVWHCADTPNGYGRYTIEDIDDWHRPRGFRRDKLAVAMFNPDLFFVGYHFVIHVDGEVRTGRHITETGAHCPPVNRTSIGVCMIGEDAFTEAQWTAAAELIGQLETQLGTLKQFGHRRFSPRRECPGFDVDGWRRRLYVPEEKHICEERK